MELKDAFGILGKVDFMFNALTLEHDSLMGYPPQGDVGIPAYSSLEEILEHVQTRRRQILDLKISIRKLQEQHERSDAAKEILAIAAELKL